MAAGLFAANFAYAAEKTNLDDAKKYMESISEQVITLLKNDNIDEIEKMARMYDFLSEKMAVQAIGRVVLGKPYRSLSPSQGKQYDALFREYILSKYSNLVGRYSGQDVEITNAVRAGKSDVMVFTKIGIEGQEPAVVGWRIRTIDGKMKLFDVKIADLSMLQTEREQFQNVYQNAQIEGVMDTLAMLVENLNTQAEG